MKLGKVHRTKPLTWKRLAQNQRKEILNTVFPGSGEDWVNQLMVTKWENIPEDVRDEMNKFNWFLILTVGNQDDPKATAPSQLTRHLRGAEAQVGMPTNTVV